MERRGDLYSRKITNTIGKTLKKAVFFILIIFTVLACSGLSDKRKVIKIKGSDTMLQLTRQLAAEYMIRHNDVSVYVEGGGTGAGAKSLAESSIDICAASRKLLPQEIKLLTEKQYALGISVLIAKDALSVYLNTNNPADDISLEELRAIFSCKINSWDKISDYDAEIEKVIRPRNSGTYAYFKRLVLETEEYCEDNSITLHTTNAVVKHVAQHKNAVGYGGIAFHDSVKHAKIDGVLPSKQNVQNDSYPIIRYLYFYTVNTPTGTVKKFIDFVLSEDGQAIVSKSGFLPLW